MEIKQTYNPVLKYVDREYDISFGTEEKPLLLKDESSIKKYYPDQNFSIRTHLFERTVKFEDNKLTLKINRFTKTRSKGKKYFRKSFDSSFFRFDLTTGNFITIFTSGKSRKNRKSKIQSNSFFSLRDFFYSSNYFEPHNFIGSKYLETDAGDIFDNDVIVEFIEHHLKIKLVPVVSPEWIISNNRNNVTHSLLEEIIKQFIVRKEIKVPDSNVYYWLFGFYPTEKFLKKNDRKLIQSILNMLGINSKYTNKIFHRFDGIDIRYFMMMYELLGGTKYMSALSNSFYTKINQKNRDVFRGIITKYNFVGGPDLTKYSLTPLEKKNLIKLCNCEGKVIDVIEMKDHFDMIKKLRLIDPSIQMRSSNPKDFRSEHHQLSTMIQHIRKGTTITYLFDDEMVRDIESPIQGEVTLYPYILKREDEYFEEGEKMHHCVGSYYDKDKSIIISLRTEDDDRVTCEYDVDNGLLIQAKHVCNAQPPKHFYDVIKNQLNIKCRHWASSNKLKSVETVKSPIRFNGIELTKENNPLIEERSMWLPF